MPQYKKFIYSLPQLWRVFEFCTYNTTDRKFFKLYSEHLKKSSFQGIVSWGNLEHNGLIPAEENIFLMKLLPIS